jgi:hypothetical protein
MRRTKPQVLRRLRQNGVESPARLHSQPLQRTNAATHESSTPLEQNDSTANKARLASMQGDMNYLRIECRPQRVIAARYDTLPFPKLGTLQEIAFDLGITAVEGDVELTGIVFRAYHEHQLLWEERWNRAILRAHTGEASLRIAQGTGLALRSIHFMRHAHMPTHYLDVVAVARKTSAADAASRAEDEEEDHEPPTAEELQATAGITVQARAQLPVDYHTQQSDLHFPLRGVWWAIQAGDWSDLHKQEVFSQPFALDLVRLGADNRFFSGGGSRLEDHYSWDQPIFATAGGKIAHVTYDMPDMNPGEMPDPRMFRGDPRRILGNAVAISHANGEFTYYAHLQQASITVNEGQMIRRGALLGKVGNSGQSPGPHLHLHLMEGPNLFIDRGLPMKLSHFRAGGQLFEEPTFIPTRMIVESAEAAE